MEHQGKYILGRGQAGAEVLRYLWGRHPQKLLSLCLPFGTQQTTRTTESWLCDLANMRNLSLKVLSSHVTREDPGAPKPYGRN